MRVNTINSCKNKVYTPSFGVNLQSPKLKFKNDDFFVRIKGYGTNSDWAKIVMNTADTAVRFIRTSLNFDSILRYITVGVKNANQLPTDIGKRTHTGILRTERADWKTQPELNFSELITNYGGRKSKYSCYKDRLDNVVQHPLKNPYKNFMLTRPVHSSDYGKFLNHANAKYINNALDMAEKKYIDIHKKYIEREATAEDMNGINSSIAEIRWILAHATPWARGSDAISNTLIRAVYKAIGVKTYPIKRGISLDLEAYCTNLDEYKKNFAEYFYHKPHIVD